MAGNVMIGYISFTSIIHNVIKQRKMWVFTQQVDDIQDIYLTDKMTSENINDRRFWARRRAIIVCKFWNILSWLDISDQSFFGCANSNMTQTLKRRVCNKIFVSFQDDI